MTNRSRLPAPHADLLMTNAADGRVLFQTGNAGAADWLRANARGGRWVGESACLLEAEAVAQLLTMAESAGWVVRALRPARRGRTHGV